MAELWQDLRYGARWLLRSPGFTAISVMTLALGVAIITAVFTLTNAFFLRSLPFEEPGRLVHVWQTDDEIGFDTLRVAVPNFADWRAQSEVFEDLGGYYYGSFTMTGETANERVLGTWLTPNLIRILGVEPLMGRIFSDDEAEPGRDRVAILSHPFWQRRFGGAPDVLDRSLTLDGEVYTVVGVMAPSFVFPFNSIDLWVPLDTTPFEDQRDSNGPLLVVGRMKAGETMASAQTELTTIMQRLALSYPESNGRRDAKVVDLRSQLLFTYDIFRVVFPALFLAVSFVILIVCANIGNLLLARSADRAREFAFRLTLGASRGRLVRQLLTEAGLLALLGGLLGTGIAFTIARLVEQNIPGELYRVGAIEVDAWALLFALGVAFATALAFGLLPALQSTRPNLTQALKEGGRGASGGRGSRRWRHALVVAEVALALLLVAGATLMVQTFLGLQEVDTGFDADNLLTMEVTLPETKYPSDTEENIYFEEVLRRVRGVNGVELASEVYPLPLNHESLGETYEVEGRGGASPDEKLFANTFWITTDYFRSMRIPVVEGRAFTDQDNDQATPVVLVNQRFAERHWPNESPVGRRVRIRDAWRTVVGVAANSIAFGLDEETPLLVYYPQLQVSTRRRFIMARTAMAPMSLVQTVRREVQAVDPDQPITTVRSMNEVLNTWLGPWLMGIGGISFLGLGALCLASMGIYGVISYSVVQRTREFGIRSALGADRGQIRKLVLRHGLLLTTLGIGIGLVGAVLLTRFLQSLLFGVGARDPITFLVAPLVLAATALLASYLPARRAVRVDPMTALRYE